MCGYTALVRCVLALRCGSAGVMWYPYAGWGTSVLNKDRPTDVTCLFFAQHVSNASTFIFRSLRLCVVILLWLKH